MAMAVLLLWGAVLGFVNGYNAAIWVLILISGIVGLTLFGIVSEDWEGTDLWAPRTTFNRTSSRIVHIERPRHPLPRYFDDDLE
jgi:hypothetical protein